MAGGHHRKKARKRKKKCDGRKIWRKKRISMAAISVKRQNGKAK